MNEYADILYHPHHVSTRRQPMSMHERAAQFASFKALTGYEEALMRRHGMWNTSWN